MLRRLALILLAAGALAGCGEEDEDGGAAAAPPAAATEEPTPTPTATATTRSRTARGRTIRVVRSQFAAIVGDGRGQAVYVFDKERAGRSECYGACARAWPPVLTRGRPVPGKGVRGRRLGTVRRRGGSRQVTFRGRPLYYYVDDAPGRVLCHNVLEFGGLWLVIRPDGVPVG